MEGINVMEQIRQHTNDQLVEKVIKTSRFVNKTLYSLNEDILNVRGKRLK